VWQDADLFPGIVEAMFSRSPSPQRFAYRPWSFALEVFMSVAILFVCIMLAFGYYPSAMVRVRLTELYVETMKLRTDLVVEHALTGRWPEPTPQSAGLGETKTPIEHLSAIDGHFNLAVRLEGMGAGPDNGLSNLSFRRVANPEFGTVFWLCGTASPRPDWQVPIPDITDIPAVYLPAVCR
jgi:hypothetical protein